MLEKVEPINRWDIRTVEQLNGKTVEQWNGWRD